MDPQTKTIVKEGATALARHALTLVGSWLVSHGFLTASNASSWEDTTAQVVAGGLLAAGAYGWSLLNKLKHAKAASVAQAKIEVLQEKVKPA